jgi:hypothetical protein
MGTARRQRELAAGLPRISCAVKTTRTVYEPLNGRAQSANAAMTATGVLQARRLAPRAAPAQGVELIRD